MLRNQTSEWKWWSQFSSSHLKRTGQWTNNKSKMKIPKTSIVIKKLRNWIYAVAIPGFHFWLISMDLWIMNTWLKSCGVTIVLRVMAVVQLRLCERIISHLCLQKSFGSCFVTMRLIKKKPNYLFLCSMNSFISNFKRVIKRREG